ncbi:hypothetical protein M9458_052946 [Cirrhinus mrigala]|uniref:CCHC-type domain-containing protein n=1 Tax=Cirrhinus mrigala TaxID=683832 RepID=A0ABD0MQC2_CIRMR
MDGLMDYDPGLTRGTRMVNDTGLARGTHAANDTGTAGGTCMPNDTVTARGIRTANDTGTARGTRKANDTGLEKRLRVRNGNNQEVSEKSVERRYLKEATVIVNVENVIEVRVEDIIKAVTEQCGHGKILALRPRQGKEYELTMEKEETCDKLIDGLRIKGVDCEVKNLQNRDYVVSFMHLPVYLDDKEILEKLEGWGVDPISKMKRRRYPGTDIEDGTRFLKVRFPKEVASLPYSTRLETAEGSQYFRVMHSHQVKTCRLCMSPDHLLKECPNFVCYRCEERGHFARDCNAVRCPGCEEVLNKCECWMEGEEGGREEQVDGQVHEENNEEEGQTDEEQGEGGLQKKETEGEREKDNINNNEQTMEQDTQWTEMEVSDSFNILLGDMERDGQGRRDQNKETDREEEIKMDNMVKDGGGKGQIRRRALKVKPNLESARKKIMTETNRFDVLRGLEGENDE